jgi:putative transposase
MRYRRSQTPGATFFFTLVTYEGKKILCLGENPGLLRQAFEAVKAKHPFVVEAIVLPPGDNEYSKRWMLIKSNFTRTCHDPFKSRPRESRTVKREQYIRQRRFWEHQI